MNFDTYQAEAMRTKRTASYPVPAPLIPLLGLAGESGALLSEYKKWLRDGEAHILHTARVSEELGDLLWYISAVAAAYNINLEDVAVANLKKCQERWGEGSEITESFDTCFPENERFPRQFDVVLETAEEHGEIKMRMQMDGHQLGNSLTDNAHQEDGYRFHDIFHLACAAMLGWSPVTRALLKRKRKSQPHIDEVEDGARAIVIEEGISALVFGYAEDHGHLQNVHTVDYDLLRTIKRMVKGFEVEVASLRDWEQMILTAFHVWHQLEQRGGGTVCLNLDERTINLQS